MLTSNQRSQQLEERLIAFAVRIVKLANALPRSFAGQHFAKQMLRSGSSPALHYGEARGAESDKDFRHKCSIALKELRETNINLQIVTQSGLAGSVRMEELLDENDQLISIFVSTVRRLDERIHKNK